MGELFWIHEQLQNDFDLGIKHLSRAEENRLLARQAVDRYYRRHDDEPCQRCDSAPAPLCSVSVNGDRGGRLVDPEPHRGSLATEEERAEMRRLLR